MRIWSFHPKYLDAKGLTALWRESLLVKKVLQGKTRGYKNHPQIIRFREYVVPLYAINAYLNAVYNEAKHRHYNFDGRKAKNVKAAKIIPVTNKQLEYEFNHLMKKLRKRDKIKYNELLRIAHSKLLLNPVFFLTQGRIAEWEKISG